MEFVYSSWFIYCHCRSHKSSVVFADKINLPCKWDYKHGFAETDMCQSCTTKLISCSSNKTKHVQTCSEMTKTNVGPLMTFTLSHSHSRCAKLGSWSQLYLATCFSSFNSDSAFCQEEQNEKHFFIFLVYCVVKVEKIKQPNVFKRRMCPHSLGVKMK